jgi:hypothetical protein
MLGFFVIMLSSFSQAFSSFVKFFSPEMVSEGEEHLFDSSNPIPTKLFLFIINSWARRHPNPETILKQFKVTTIMHNKKPTMPQHEFLIIETENTATSGTVPSRFLILERFTSDLKPAQDENNDRADKLLETFTELLKTATSSLKSSQLVSMEEGLGSGMLVRDGISLSAIQLADLVMDTLKQSSTGKAVDQYEGGNIFEKRDLGQVVQFFKPLDLTLFDLAIIAQVVHEANPNYSRLHTQCYYFAALVYEAAEKYAGVLVSESADKTQTGLVKIQGSYLSNKCGRWNGVKVTHVDRNSSVVDSVLARFEEERRNQIEEVFFKHKF